MKASGGYFSKSKSDLEKEVLFVGEGQDDAYFFDSILSHLGADPAKVGIVYTDGKDNLDRNLRNIVQSRPFVRKTIRKIAILQDVDDEPRERLETIHKALKSVSLPIPKHCEILEFEKGRMIGTFLIPDMDRTGNLESLCFESVAASPKSKKVRAFFDEMQSEFGDLDRYYKRLIQIYLACVPVECRGVGRATKIGVFPMASASFAEVLTFFDTFLGK